MTSHVIVSTRGVHIVADSFSAGIAALARVADEQPEAQVRINLTLNPDWIDPQAVIDQLADGTPGRSAHVVNTSVSTNPDGALSIPSLFATLSCSNAPFPMGVSRTVTVGILVTPDGYTWAVHETACRLLIDSLDDDRTLTPTVAYAMAERLED